MEKRACRVQHSAYFDELEEVYDELRRRLPYNEKSKVKKSHIVELALQQIVEDYRKKGDKSLLVKHFIKD